MFKAPLFSDLNNNTLFQSLQQSLQSSLNFAVDTVHLCCLYFDNTDYLITPVQFFPLDHLKYFGFPEIASISSFLGNQDYKPPQGFGPYLFLDPEYYTTQQLSDKSDVYSFGIVMLELVTARPPIKDGKFIVRLVKAALEKGGISGLQGEVMDPFLRKSSETETLTGFERFLGLALSCVEESGFERSSMREVVKELELIMEMGSGFSADSIPARRNSFVKKGQPPLP